MKVVIRTLEVVEAVLRADKSPRADMPMAEGSRLEDAVGDLVVVNIPPPTEAADWR